MSYPGITNINSFLLLLWAEFKDRPVFPVQESPFCCQLCKVTFTEGKEDADMLSKWYV
jgi:hypothetical protein